MDSEKFIETLSNELAQASIDLQETQKLDQKVQLSILIKNLTESLRAFSSIPTSGFQAVDISEEDELEINSVIDEKFM